MGFQPRSRSGRNPRRALAPHNLGALITTATLADSVTQRAMPARELLMAGMHVRSIADDIRRFSVVVTMSCRCTRLTALGAWFNARLPEARRRQRYRPEDRRGEQSEERYFHTVGKAHGWLSMRRPALDQFHTRRTAATCPPARGWAAISRTGRSPRRPPDRARAIRSRSTNRIRTFPRARTSPTRRSARLGRRGAFGRPGGNRPGRGAASGYCKTARAALSRER